MSQNVSILNTRFTGSLYQCVFILRAAEIELSGCILCTALLYICNLFCGLCGLTVEHLLAIQKVAGSNLGQSASR